MIVSALSSPAIGSGSTPLSGHSTAMSTSRRSAIQRQSPTACSATTRQSTEPPKSAWLALSRRAMVSNCDTSRSSLSMPRVTLSCAWRRSAASWVRCTTSHWALTAAKGVRNSWAASAVRRRSCSISVPTRASKPFIASVSTFSSPGTCELAKGVASSGRRRSNCFDRSRTGRIAWRTAKISNAINTGSPTSQGTIWPAM
ncbi:hypothetical protein D3C71_1337980 [compost metagenome]